MSEAEAKGKGFRREISVTKEGQGSREPVGRESIKDLHLN